MKYRNSCPEVFCKKALLKILQNWQESTCARFSFLGFQAQACNFIKKSDYHKSFPVNFAKIVKISFFIEHLQWLLLEVFDSNIIEFKEDLENAQFKENTSKSFKAKKKKA